MLKTKKVRLAEGVEEEEEEEEAVEEEVEEEEVEEVEAEEETVLIEPKVPPEIIMRVETTKLLLETNHLPREEAIDAQTTNQNLIPQNLLAETVLHLQKPLHKLKKHNKYRQ